MGKRTDKERFESKTMPEPNTGCWFFLNAIKPSGYCYFKFAGEGARLLAHRASYKIYKGEIPKGMLVLHDCDNRLCVNPDHLFLGTHKDNTQDMIRKGRHGRSNQHSRKGSTIKILKTWA